MRDTDFERQTAKAAALFTNDGYFSRYRELIAQMGCRSAWEKVESEMPFGLRRFVSYDAFKKALRFERLGILPNTIRLQCVSI